MKKLLFIGLIGLTAVCSTRAQLLSDTRRPEIIFQANDPGWQPKGTIWVGTPNYVAKVQTVDWNTNGTVVFTNWIAVCTSNCAGGSSAVYTNYLGGYYTNTVSQAAWSNLSVTAVSTGNVNYAVTIGSVTNTAGAVIKVPVLTAN